MVDSHSTPRELAATRPRRRIWLLISAACVVPAILDAAQTYFQSRISGEQPRWQDIVFQGTEWLFLGALLPITYNLAKSVPLNRKRGGELGDSLCGRADPVSGMGDAGRLARLRAGAYPAGNYLGWILTSIPWSVFMYFTVLGCVYAFSYFTEAREREASEARLSAQLSEARLGALRMQLHPHFLFNSLNAITVLVREQNTAAASRMLELLGDVLRQVLRADQPHEIPLSDELAFLEQYLAIEQVRFSDRLRVEWAVEERARRAWCRASCCSHWSRMRSNTGSPGAPRPDSSRSAQEWRGICSSSGSETMAAGCRRRPAKGLGSGTRGSGCVHSMVTRAR